jgi:hypothetical protein
VGAGGKCDLSLFQLPRCYSAVYSCWLVKVSNDCVGNDQPLYEK